MDVLRIDGDVISESNHDEDARFLDELEASRQVSIDIDSTAATRVNRARYFPGASSMRGMGDNYYKQDQEAKMITHAKEAFGQLLSSPGAKVAQSTVSSPIRR